ncbi:uncharacterized protein LOC105184112 [Harpegnathos saltator]|uniref:uncharacterized protein LOC105184112 n=1 Tax=Harpegnathos saltator TaxID=610380 RepID=UPI000DBEEC26|nr:uncharacterized protein LOC105184112 [Harpegnathos saltator]
MPVLVLLALMYKNMYKRKGKLRRGLRAGEPLAGALQRLKHQGQQFLLQRWKRRLCNAKYGRRSVEAVQLCLAEWTGRESGTLTFRTTQLFTGYGCFGEYLCRIGKEHTVQCHHCEADHDSAQHTLQDCPAWAVERRVVVRELGQDLSLPSVVSSILGSERKWDCFTAFCEGVMKQEEEAEENRRQAERSGRAQRRR